MSSTAGAVNREWPLRWANRRRQWAAGMPWARCRHRGPREGPAWGTHWHSSGETSGSTASGTQLRPQVTAKVSVAVSFRAAVGLLPDLGYPVTLMLAKHHPSHVGVGARRDRFSTIAKRGRRCLREPAHGLGEWPRAIARRGRAFTGPQDFGPLGRCTHIGVGARRDRFSTIDERGRRCFREPAHGLGKCLRAMARRGRRLPDLRVSAPSVVARILAWARDTTDFRPSINGVGSACASRRTA